MELAYKYTAHTQIGQILTGTVFSKKKDFAYITLKRAGLKAKSVNLDLGATVHGWMHTGFNQRDLARFYSTIGKRINNGRPLIEGLMPAAEFIDDPRLKQAILVVQQSVADGASLSHSMNIAGFERRDTMAIRAAEESGKTGDAFISLSADVSRREKLAAQLKSMFLMPKIMLTALYIGSFFAVWLLAPKLQHFMHTLNMGSKKTPDPFQAAYFSFSNWVNDNFILGALIWIVPIVLIVWWVKSGYFESAMDHIKVWRLISEKSDMSTTWTAFGLLYDTGVPPYECARIVKTASRREKSQEAWLGLEKNFLSGHSISDAVEKAKFPSYIISAIKAAESSGSSIPEEIRGICLILEEDVSLLTERFKVFADLVIKLVLALAIFAAALVTILPYMRLVITNA